MDSVRGRSLLFFDLVHWYVVWSKRMPPAMLLIIFDAIGLGSYTVVGVLVAFHVGTAPFLLWGPIFGVLSSCGGGILRDMLRAQANITQLKSEIYPEISLVWGGIYSLLISWIDVGGHLPPVPVTLSGIAVMIGIFATRMIFVQTRLRPPLVGPWE